MTTGGTARPAAPGGGSNSVANGPDRGGSNAPGTGTGGVLPGGAGIGATGASSGGDLAAGGTSSHAAGGTTPMANTGGTTGPSGSSGSLGSAGSSNSAGSSGSAGSADGSSLPAGIPGLGAHPTDGGAATVGGTMTFTNVGASGWWPRRLNRDPSDSACSVKSGTDTWGGACCLTQHATDSTHLAPFDEEMTLLLKAVRIRQLAVYQPANTAQTTSAWSLISAWDDRDGLSHNIWATQTGDGSNTFPGDFTHDDCVWYVTQTPSFDCGNGRDYYCPSDPGIKHLGWSGSKLIVMLASMAFDDAGVKACQGTGASQPGPWIAFVSSELTRDGGRKWNGLCNCYSKTGSVGDGCGEINLFEVVMDNNSYSNREFVSTGVRSFQAGHVGGNVCGSGCSRGSFPGTQDVVDACGKAGYGKGPTLEMGGSASGCPVWIRPNGDRYLVVLLDGERRTIQVAMVHPGVVPSALGSLLPDLPSQVTRETIDGLVDLRLP